MVGNTVPGLVIQYAVGANGMAAGTTNRNASVESYMWWAGDKGIVFEALILGQIVYDQRRVVFIIKIGLEGELPRQPNSMVADALVFWKYRSAPL
jgi:hypothetical protein